MKIAISLISLFALLLKETMQQTQQCPSYGCGNLDIGICEAKNTQPSDLNYTLQDCGHNSMCPWSDKQDKISCKASTDEIGQAYPGSYCETNDDCLNGNCDTTKNTCVGVDGGKACTENRDCYFGAACLNKICTALLDKGNSCASDSECKRNLACYKGVCTDYFSLSDGTNLSGNESQFLCKSGFAVDNICRTLKNTDKVTTNCNINFPCNYTDSNGLALQYDTCQCAYNRLNQANCMLGSENNTHYTSYLNMVKDTITGNFSLNCNAEEPRFQYCRDYRRNNWDVKKKVIQMQKEQIWAQNANRLQGADWCVDRVVYGFDDTPPQPRNNKWQCPQYKCQGIKFDDKSCAYSINPFNENGGNVTVYLNKVCAYNERCNFQQTLLFSNWTTNHTCQEINIPTVDRKKFPGESCKDHSNCTKSDYYPDIGFCIDGKCNGHGENENCTVHSDCLVGLFCNGLKCKKQKTAGQFCIDKYECLNNLGCLNNTCREYYSLKNGTYVSSNHADKIFCEFGVINADTNQCSSLTYKNQTPNSDGFVQCNLGDSCYYTTGYYKDADTVTVTKPCECGYNAEGYGYCPLPPSYHSSDWTSGFKAYTKRLQNKCHTLSRSPCVEDLTVEQFNDEKKWEARTKKAHLFYKAVPCASVLSSSFINVSILMLFLVISIVF